MTSEELDKLRVEAVLDALVARCLNIDDGIYEYDRKELQNDLTQAKIAQRLSITPDIQYKIVMDLAKRKVLATDRMRDERLSNLFRLPFDPGCIPSMQPKLFWENQTRWAYEKFQENGNIGIEEAYIKYGDRLFIRMTETDIKRINYEFKASHTAQLRLIKNRKSPKTLLCVAIDEDEPITIATLSDEGMPFKILKRAMKGISRGKWMSRDLLIDEGIIPKEKKNLSLRTDVFKEHWGISAVSPLLLEIESNRLKINNVQNVTLYEIDQLMRRLKLR